MNKWIVSMVLALAFVGCASSKKEMGPSAQEQVRGIQKMCKEAAPAMKERQAKKSLYERLGKRKGIHTFFVNLVAAHRNNKKIAHLFKNTNDKTLITHSTEFLTVGSGGPGKYTGKSMKKTHAHLNITSADFMAAGEDVQSTMKKLGYGPNETQEVICAISSFIPQVVVDL